MKAVMLAAGIGARLRNSGVPPAPKVLLRFEGRSLLRRHIDILERQGIDELVLGVGFNRQEIETETAAIGAEDFVTTVFNPDYTHGSVVTLADRKFNAAKPRTAQLKVGIRPGVTHSGLAHCAVRGTLGTLNPT